MWRCSIGSAGTRRSKLAVLGIAAALVWLPVGLSGCQSEEKVVHYKPFFTGLEGAEFGSQSPVMDDRERAKPAGDVVGDEGGESDSKLIVENRDGSKRLVRASPLHVMRLLELLLDEGEDELIIDQLLSERTLLEFGGADRNAQQAVDYLREHRRDLAVLFARMPLAENSPTVIVDQPGDRVWVIRLTGRPAEGLRFTKLWVRMEKGQWRFMWVT